MHSQKRDGVIAQLVEQRTENPCVPGSIPGDTTLKIKQLQHKSNCFFRVFLAVLTLKSGKITLIYADCVNRRVNRVNHSKSYLLQV